MRARFDEVRTRVPIFSDRGSKWTEHDILVVVVSNRTDTRVRRGAVPQRGDGRKRALRRARAPLRRCEGAP